jgi:hypothetical protein
MNERMTRELFERLGKLPSIEESQDKGLEEMEVGAKVFNPYGQQTWYIAAYDPEEKEAYGFVNLIGRDCAELGFFEIKDVLEGRGLFGGFEVDIYFEPKPMKEVMDKVYAGGHV